MDVEAHIRLHEQMVDAIERRDLDAARKRLIEHLRTLKERARRATTELDRSQETGSSELRQPKMCKIAGVKVANLIAGP